MCFKLLLAYLQPVVATPLRHLEECRGYFIGSKLTGSTVGNCLPRSVDRMIVGFGLSHVFLCMVTEAIASSSVLSFLPIFVLGKSLTTSGLCYFDSVRLDRDRYLNH